MRTRDGYEYQLGVNHLGHFLLTNMLLPLLLRDPGAPAATGSGARIVNVASAAHLFGTINFADLNSRGSYDRWRAYGQSKLANILFSNELARRLPTATTGVTVNSLHPGVVATELGRFLLPDGETAWWQAPLVAAASAFALTPPQGAATSVYLASSREVEGVSGEYFDKGKPIWTSAEARNGVVARRLWDTSVELVGLDGGSLLGSGDGAAAM